MWRCANTRGRADRSSKSCLDAARALSLRPQPQHGAPQTQTGATHSLPLCLATSQSRSSVRSRNSSPRRLRARHPPALATSSCIALASVGGGPARCSDSGSRPARAATAQSSPKPHIIALLLKTSDCPPASSTVGEESPWAQHRQRVSSKRACAPSLSPVAMAPSSSLTEVHSMLGCATPYPLGMAGPSRRSAGEKAPMRQHSARSRCLLE
eukprot:scaffold19149_cov146-Isochrysis_galbana.AAC.3